MTKRKYDIPGNAQASAEIYADEMFRLGSSAYNLEHHLEQMSEEGITIVALRFRYQAGPRGDVLCVVTAATENGKIVAFHAGDSFASAMKGTIARIVNRSLKWKEDQYDQ